MANKTYITIPYRNRIDCIIKQAIYLQHFLETKNLNNSVFINYVEQKENLFNIAFTINVGFKIIEQNILDNDNYWFLPVDVLPININFEIEDNKVLCTASGKSHAFKCKDFKKINGYTLKQYGYGFDDHELRKRCEHYGLSLSNWGGLDYAENSNIYTFKHLESKQKTGSPCMANYEKNRDLSNNHFNPQNDGLNSMDFEITDRFMLLPNIAYNQFIIKKP
jgi:hypothetical protein